ncbi:polyprenyl diphosphate synthase [[Mycoplasma] testudinis]|uniref:polyprenyl diphosphate synthase n=1 Tax=[Mycoplasma] testudinis TaxID=33924 RepID=UPI0004878ACC|nr:polyprenyl diphosphate synthase [[Mycoplasma] testudinis]
MSDSITNLPTHLAFIMDGNGRWAKKLNKTRTYGHREGAERLKDIIKATVQKKISYVSFFAFGLENWKRPTSETNFIWNLVKVILTKKVLKWFQDNNVRFKWIGFREDYKISPEISKILNETQTFTKNFTGTTVCLVMNYSGEADILQVVKKYVLNPSLEVDQKTFSSQLLTAEIPDVDLLIRTSGEQRISNFMLWQIRYSELIFSDVLWPDFNAIELDKCLAEYANRNRRFGGL